MKKLKNLLRFNESMNETNIETKIDEILSPLKPQKKTLANGSVSWLVQKSPSATFQDGSIQIIWNSNRTELHVNFNPPRGEHMGLDYLSKNIVEIVNTILSSGYSEYAVLVEDEEGDDYRYSAYVDHDDLETDLMAEDFARHIYLKIQFS